MPKATIAARPPEKSSAWCFEREERNVTNAGSSPAPALPWLHHVFTTSRAVCATLSYAELHCLTALRQVLWRPTPTDWPAGAPTSNGIWLVVINLLVLRDR